MTDIELHLSEDEFKKLPPEDQNWTILKTFSSQVIVCDTRICALEGDVRRFKWVHTAAAGVGGFFGGVMAVILKNSIFK